MRWDWYWFSDGPYRHRALEEGFLKAPNCEDIKFAIMWANHNPIYAHPGSYWKPAEINWSGAVDPKTFRDCTDYCIKNFLGKPNYLRLPDGSLYFMLYRLGALVEEVGGLDTAAALIREFRDKVEKAGLGKLHISTVFEALPNVWRALESPEHDFTEINHFIETLTVDSITSYGWGYKDDFPATDYAKWAKNNHYIPLVFNKHLKCAFNPNVLTGWDSSARTVQSDMFENRNHPFGPVVVNNTPERFQEELQFAKNILASDESRGQMIKISCWNEWTEGAYLEPDTQYGYGFLQAVKNVFGAE